MKRPINYLYIELRTLEAGCALRVTVDIPEDTLAEIEKARTRNKLAVNPEQRKKSDTLESFVLHLIEAGLGEE